MLIIYALIKGDPVIMINKLKKDCMQGSVKIMIVAVHLLLVIMIPHLCFVIDLTLRGVTNYIQLALSDQSTYRL